MRALMEDISLHNECCQDFLKPYGGVFNEMWTIDGIVLKGNQAVLPVSLRAKAIRLAHEGHKCADRTLQLLWQTCWFPGMRKQVQDFVASCLPCNAAQPHMHPVPLQPNFLPDRPWLKVHADFKGPIGGKYYLHAVIDQYSKFPEVDLVSSTSFKKLKSILDRIFSTHGILESPLTMDHCILAKRWQNMQRKWDLRAIFCKSHPTCDSRVFRISSYFNQLKIKVILEYGRNFSFIRHFVEFLGGRETTVMRLMTFTRIFRYN